LLSILIGLISATLLVDPAETNPSTPSFPGAARHWSLEPVRPPRLPTVVAKGWSTNPIDQFVLAEIERNGISPAPPALPAAILRRTFLAIVGLPPTPEQQAEFEKLPSNAALDEWVDSLLEHPGYGERWARHWLDLVRYADSNGYERDSDKPFAWRYRDYVIRSLNEDKPFAQFMREQIAGDSIAGLPTEAQVGLGYYLIGPWDDEPTNPEQARYDQLDDFASTTSQVFLGIDIGCARCHDHKQDPISQEDYYSFAAIFADVRRPVKQGREMMMRLGNAEQVEQSQTIMKRLDELQHSIVDLRWQLAKSLQASQKMEPTSSPASSGTTTKEPTTGHESMESPGEITRKLVDLRRQATELERELPALSPAYLPNFDGPLEPCHVLLRGEIDRKDKQVAPNLPTHFRSLVPTHSSETFGRKELAEWLSHPDHPLVARVIVNRVWQYHFGKGLVATPNDFGLGGESPTHPELLDWLAHWLVREAGWSLKKLHRLILTSNTFRMSQRGLPNSVKADPQNRLYSRFPRHRLEVEAIHDAMLDASGRLNSKMFGPPFYPFLNEEVKRSHESAHRAWLPFAERDASRRAIYAVVKRSLAVPFFEAMDRSDPNRCVGQRTASSGASHALVALNDEFVVRQSRRLAERMTREGGGDVRSQIILAYRLVLCRPPTPEEVDTFMAFMQEDDEERRRNGSQQGDLATLAEACRALFNLSEFYYPD
jgi:hypothetical protein